MAFSVMWSLSVLETVLVSVFLLVLYQVLRKTLFSPLRFVPGPLSTKLSSFWIIVQCRRARRSEMVHRLHCKYGDIVRIAPNHVSIADPRALQDIYGHNTGFIKGPFYEAFHQAEPGLFNLRDPDTHQKRRKVITPAFSLANLKAFEPQVSSSVLKLRQTLSNIAESEQPTTDFAVYANFLAFDIIADYSFGRTFGFLDRGYDHLNLIESIDSRGIVANALGYMLSWCRPLMKYNVFDRFWYRGLSALVYLAVLGREAYFTRKADTAMKDRKDVLSFLLGSENEKAASAFPEAAVIAESISLIIGGSDSTSGTMTHFVDLVSRDPLLQRRLQDELDAAFPGVQSDDNWVADFGTADKLPILRATLRETMRLRPTSATGLERVTPPGGRMVADVAIPAGTLVSVPLRTIMLDARIFKDPTAFNIDRWLQPDAAQLLEYYKPFSLGPRSCIGRNFAWMEAIKTLATLFRLFDFSRARTEPTELREGFILKAEECMLIVLLTSSHLNIMESSDISAIELLPSEILESVLVTFPTPSLIALASVSRRFHAVVEDLVYYRMRHAVCTQKYQLLLESYHPSARSLTPVLSCDYLGTEGLDVYGKSSMSSVSSLSSLSSSSGDDAPSLGSLLGMYSCYHVHPQEDLWTHCRRARRGSMSPLASSAAVSAAALSAMGVPPPYRFRGAQPAYHDVVLDEGELFSQLCTVMHLSRGSPHKGVYLSCGVVSSSVVRIFRDWLAHADNGKGAAATAAGAAGVNSNSTHGILRQAHDSDSDSDSDCGMDEAVLEADGADGVILWADYEKNVGIRFRVTERQLPHNPPARPFDEEPVAYTLQYQELVVRTYQLLLSIEKAETQDASYCLH